MGQKPIQHPLTEAQRSLLAKGPNYAISPRHSPYLEFITAIESACQKLNQQGAEEHIHGTHDFVKQDNKVTLQPGECLSSYNVSALFTSVPVDPALGIIKGLLEQDNTLKERTVLPVKDIILLLEFCLHNTYFSFQGKFYKQVEGAAVGSPVSPIVANLNMEYFEQNALSTATHPLAFGPGMWMIHLSSKRKSTTALPRTYE